MEINKAIFYGTIMDEKLFPSDGLAEIALAGRSNVGKSSFINSICNNSKLARTSKTAGKTVTLNFYLINDSFFIVDMPGYGYAANMKDELLNFSKVTDKYVQNRSSLKGIVQLIDSRTITKDDIMMNDYLKSNNIPFLVILSKIDKLKRNDIKKRIKITKDTLGIDESNIITYSSLTKENLDNVLLSLDKLCI